MVLLSFFTIKIFCRSGGIDKIRQGGQAKHDLWLFPKWDAGGESNRWGLQYNGILAADRSYHRIELKRFRLITWISLLPGPWFWVPRLRKWNFSFTTYIPDKRFNAEGKSIQRCTKMAPRVQSFQQNHTMYNNKKCGGLPRSYPIQKATRQGEEEPVQQLGRNGTREVKWSWKHVCLLNVARQSILESIIHSPFSSPSVSSLSITSSSG